LFSAPRKPVTFGVFLMNGRLVGQFHLDQDIAREKLALASILRPRRTSVTFSVGTSTCSNRSRARAVSIAPDRFGDLLFEVRIGVNDYTSACPSSEFRRLSSVDAEQNGDEIADDLVRRRRRSKPAPHHKNMMVVMVVSRRVAR